MLILKELKKLISRHNLMKTLLMIASCSLCGSSAYSAESKGEVFRIENEKVLSLNYDPSAEGATIAQTLYFESNGGKSVIDSVEAAHLIYADGAHGLRSYNNCSIVAADYQSAQLLVLYAFEEGRQHVFRSDESLRGYAKPHKVKRDLLLVSYFEEEGVWKTEMSVYIQTLWGDIIGEQVTGVEISGEGKYEVIFDGEWTIEGTKTPISDNRKKVKLSTGTETKALIFDGESEMIFSVNGQGEKFFSKHTLWWLGENKTHIEELRVQSDTRM